MSGVTGVESADVVESGARALKLQTDTPHLVNIGGDRLSTSVTLHPIPPGRVTLGCGAGVDIPVHGTGVLPLHCHIENSEGIVTIYPLSENLSIDGVKIFGPTRLSQGVMLTIGRSNYMRFNHPAEAKIMKSVLPNPRISMAPMNFEPVESNDYQPTKFVKKPPAVPKKSPRESLNESGVEEPPPSSIMTKVSKFEYLAQQNFKKSISPKVFSSNLVTVNTPAKDVLGKSPPDIQNFTKNLPQNALNYSDLNHNEKLQLKTPDRPIFGKKSPQYVNVTVSETKNINNKVIIYENGCIPKNQNMNIDHNDLNNKIAGSNKNINVNRVLVPSPSYNRNTSPYFRSATPNPISVKIESEYKRSGSLGEISSGGADVLDNLALRKSEAELRRTQAHQDRLKEQEMEKAEQARLEEILNMCVEYEKQAHCEKSKVIPNRIKTNGSLPRDKRQFGGPLSPIYGTPPPSPRNFEKQNSSYENVHFITDSVPQKTSVSYENINIKHDEEMGKQKSISPYENVILQQQQQQPQNTSNIAQSPRTRIKTFVQSQRDHSTKDAAEIIENKFAILEAEQFLLQNLASMNGDRKTTGDTNKFIYPLEETDVFVENENSKNISNNFDTSNYAKISPLGGNRQLHKIDSNRLEKLKRERKDVIAGISSIKRQMAEIEIQEEELRRELDMEYALISGEQKFKMLDVNDLEGKKETLVKYAHKIEENMHHCQIKQDEDQQECKTKLENAQKHMQEIEQKLAQTPKTDSTYEQVFEDYLNAQEILDNEKKTFEDLEFHHLEEEADWLASREEIQREILDLSKKIEMVQEQIQDLEQQKLKLSKNNPEFKLLRRKKSEYYNQLERKTFTLRKIDNELSFGSNNRESEHEISSDSDSDKSKEIDKRLSNISLDNVVVYDMSCSVIVSNSKTPIDHVYNMSQSFNEKLLQEKSILEPGGEMGQKYPSQDDIDRISKVTSSAPIDINEEKGSLSKKAIESLKDIQRKRHLHLCQQGSQVIEQERQRVLALKQRVQQEARSEWEQRRQDCNTSTEQIESLESSNSSKQLKETEVLKPAESTINESNNDATASRPVSDGGTDSPRPMSEISDMSVEVGTLNKRRGKVSSDKQRPLTRYLPIRGSDLDLRQHIESAGHQVVLCPHVIINSHTCRGFLHKKGSKLNGWSKRWFVFDRNKHTFTYYNDKSEKKARGGAYFQAIEEVYLDHLNNVKSPNPQLTFIVKTHERFYYLMAPSPEAMRIWVDVIFTGAEGYQEFEHGS